MRPVVAFVSTRGWKILSPLHAAGVNPLSEIWCKGGVRGYLGAFCRLLLTLAKTDNDAVILTDTPHYIGMMATIGSILFKRDLIFRARGDALTEYASRNMPIHAFFFRYLLMRKCKLIISVSYYLKKVLVEQGFDESKIQVVSLPQPLPTTPILPMEKRVQRILIVTSFKLHGKCDALYKLLPGLDRFLSDHPEFTVAIAGGGPYLIDFSTAVGEYRNGARIELLGFVNNISKYYESSLVLVHASDLDAHPSVINEARSFATPVIVDNTVGMPEQIENGEDGMVLFSVDELKTALERILYPETWMKLSANGRARVLRNNSVETIGTQFRDALQSVN